MDNIQLDNDNKGIARRFNFSVEGKFLKMGLLYWLYEGTQIERSVNRIFNVRFLEISLKG